MDNKNLTAFNFFSLVQYSGRNATIAGNGELNAFATFNQIKQMGYQVNKGAKSISIFTGYHLRTNKKTGEEEQVPTYARVFDIEDTTAKDDKEFYNYLINEAEIQPAKTVVDQAIVSSMLSGKAVKATDLAQSMGIEVIEVN